MKGSLRILVVASAVLTGIAACSGGGAGGVSGRYVGNLPGEGGEMAFDFHGDGKATMSVGEGGNGVDLDCTWEKGEKRIAVSCPGSSGISMTALDGGDLEADMGGTIVRFKKD
jgi:hypothetical protein